MDQGTTDGRRDAAHFHVLDGLRGVAALTVLVGHASSAMLGAPDNWVPRKSLAVVFFFMLSGFVVSSAYQSRMRGGLSLTNFMLRRVIRLYPLIVLGAIIGILWFGLFDRHFWVGWRSALLPILNLLGLPSITTSFTADRFAINPPEWSLFFEMIAYGAFGSYLARASTRSLGLVALVCAVGFAVADWWYMPFIPLRLMGFEAGAAFCGGVLLWRFREAYRLLEWQVPFPVLAAVIVALCVCPLALTPLADYVALLLVFPAVLLIGAARGRREASTLEKVLGDLSYPLYITHWFCLVVAVHTVRPWAGAHAGIAARVVASVGVAWLAMRFYDVPLRAWLMKRFLVPIRHDGQTGAEVGRSHSSTRNSTPCGVSGQGQIITRA